MGWPESFCRPLEASSNDTCSKLLGYIGDDRDNIRGGSPLQCEWMSSLYCQPRQAGRLIFGLMWQGCGGEAERPRRLLGWTLKAPEGRKGGISDQYRKADRLVLLLWPSSSSIYLHSPCFPAFARGDCYSTPFLSSGFVSTQGSKAWTGTAPDQPRVY